MWAARPDLGFPGAWLYPPGSAQVVLHVYWDQLKYRLQQQAGAGTWQLFLEDPNGAKVELDFEARETL